MARKKGPLDAVQFTRESAERIASVVREAETAPSTASPLTFDAYFDERNRTKVVRTAVFSGSWPIGSSKIVTFKTAPAVTAVATNLLWPIVLPVPSPEDCIVGKDKGDWYLVAPRLDAVTAFTVTSTAKIDFLTSVTVTGNLDPESCEINLEVSTQGRTAFAIVRGYTSFYYRPRGQGV